RTTGSGLRIFAVPMMISVAGVIVLATPVARLFASPALSAIIAAHATAQILILLAVGMSLRSGHFSLLLVFYAAETALIPMIVQVGAAAVSLSLAYGLAPLVPVEGRAYLVAIIFTVVHFLQFGLTHVLVLRYFCNYGVIGVIGTYIHPRRAAVVAGILGVALLYPMVEYT